MGDALEGIKVLDLTRVMSGPFASVMLGDLGADVVKVEAVGVGDIMRHMGGHQRGGVAAIFLGLNRGKRSIAVDLRNAEGRGVVRELAALADVVLENFRPGVCAAMGLGADDLHAVNPELVYVSINGFGSRSPAAGEPAYDTMMQGRTGMVARQRRGVRGMPDLVRSFAVDKITGFFAVQAVLSGLFARSRGGGGQTVEVPMFDASLYYLWADSMTDIAFVGDGVEEGTLFPLGMQLTETADGYITHLALSSRERAGVARAVGRADLLDDERFATTAEWSKPAHLKVFQAAVARGFLTLTRVEALERLRAEDVPCAPVAEPHEVLCDEHVRGTDVLTEYEAGGSGLVRQVRYPARVAGGVPRVPGAAPRLGGHSREVLEGAGFDAERIEALLAAGVVTDDPRSAG